MSQETIIGKDELPAKTIARFEKLLADIGIATETIEEKNPVPGVYSCTIIDSKCRALHANGKGETALAAKASALGEFLERLSTHCYFSDYYLGDKAAQREFTHYPDERWFAFEDGEIPEGLFDENMRQAWNIDDIEAPETLVELQTGNEERGILAFPFKNLSTGEETFVPACVLDNLFSSNGMSAGNTFEEASVQALSEIIERNVKNRIIAGGITLPKIPDSVLEDNGVAPALAAIRKAGYPVWALDASLGGKYPVICVLLFDPSRGGCLASFGAHPMFRAALGRTVTEMLQGRMLGQFDDFNEPSLDASAVSSPENLEAHFVDSSGLLGFEMIKGNPDHEFCAWDHSGSNKEMLAYLVSLINSEGKTVYERREEGLGISAVRYIVPGFSEVFSPDSLLESNTNIGTVYRDFVLDFANADIDERSEFFDSLAENGVSDTANFGATCGLLLRGEPWFATLTFGELKAMTAMAEGNADAADYWIGQILGSCPMEPEKASFYKCCRTLIALDSEGEERSHYLDGLAALYGENSLKLAIDHLNGEGYFAPYGLDSMLAEDFPCHASLIEEFLKATACLEKKSA